MQNSTRNDFEISNKKVVFHFVFNIGVGGVETAIVHSYIYLNKNIDYKVITFGNNDQAMLYDIKLNNPKNIFECNSIKDFTTLIKLIKYGKPDLIISSLWKAHIAVFLLSFIFKIKWVTFIHSSKFTHWLDKISTKFAIKKSYCFFTDGKSGVDFIKSNVPMKNYNSKIISFILEKKFKKTDSALDLYKVKAVYIGRMNQVKRLDKSIYLINMLRNSGINISLDLYGPANLVELVRIKAYSKKYIVENYVNYMGVLKHEQVFDTLDKYNLFFQFSDFEGMAMSVVEAMQCGKVCLVTPVGEIKYYSKHMQSAIHLQGDNFTKFIRDILEVLQNKDLYTYISNNSYQTFLQYPVYSESFLEAILKVIEE